MLFYTYLHSTQSTASPTVLQALTTGSRGCTLSAHECDQRIPDGAAMVREPEAFQYEISLLLLPPTQ